MVVSTDGRLRRERALEERRRERARARRRLTSAFLALSCVVMVVVGVVLVGAIQREYALDDYQAAASDFERLAEVVEPAEFTASVASAQSALAVESPLVSSESAADFAAATDAALQIEDELNSIADSVPVVSTPSADPAELAAASAQVDDGKAALRHARDHVTARAELLKASREAFVAAIVANGEALLDEYSDAERAAEDSLYAAVHALPQAQDLAGAIATADAAAASVRDSALAYRAQIAAEATGVQPTGGDVSAQLSYLLEHATSYNTAQWGDYNPQGGDCVNFTSQGLLARGWKMDRTWNSPGGLGASETWVYTPAMDTYLRAAGFRASGADDLDRVRVGDIGIFSWGEKVGGNDHTMTVSKVEYTPDGPVVSFVSHNSDGQYRELKTALYTEHSNSTVRIYSIP